MPTEIFCRITDPFGVPLLDVTGGFILDYTMNCAPGAVGVLELTTSPAIDPNLLFPDGRIFPYRSVDGRVPTIDNGACYLMETFKYTPENTFIRAYHANTLASRRYVAYASGTSFANKSATFADNLIKAFWRENAGSLIDASRDGVETYADWSAYVQVQPDLSLGPSIAMSGSRDPLDNLLVRICDASSTAGTYLTYEIVALSDTLFEFRTYVTVRGVDHSVGTALPVILSQARGNLENVSITFDYHTEVTFAIAGGQGQNSDRQIQTLLEASRASISPFHRIERFVDMSNVADNTVLQDDADAAVRSNRPFIMANGTLIDTPSCTRGIHYDLGDIVTFESPRTSDQLDVRLELIHEHYDASGSKQAQPLTAHQKTVHRSLAGLRAV